MKVLQISKYHGRDCEKSQQIRDITLGNHNINIVHLSPTLLSAITAMRAAKVVDKQMIDIIETDEPKNAMAAISARQLAKRKPKVVMIVRANSEVARNIPKDLVKGVDAWVFESQRLMEIYPSELKKQFCGITEWQDQSATKSNLNTSSEGKSLSEEVENKEDCKKNSLEDNKKAVTENSLQTKNVLRIGNITNAETIRLAMNTITGTDTDITLRICGAGLAATVMPLVRLHRSLPHKDRIKWVGEEYDAKAEISNCDLLLQADLDINPEEAAAILEGKHIIKYEQLKQLIDNEIITEYSPSAKDVISREVYAKQIYEIYNNL